MIAGARHAVIEQPFFLNQAALAFSAKSAKKPSAPRNTFWISLLGIPWLLGALGAKVVGASPRSRFSDKAPASFNRRTFFMAWFLLVIAGILEAAWAIGLKYTHGFTKPLPSVLTIAGIVASMYLLSVAARTLPIGTAYGVWVGIGTFGTVVLGMALLGEPATLPRIFFLALLLVAIVGLKFTTH